MIVDFLVRRFVPDCDAIQNPKVRARYGALSGLVGICLNLCLFAFKFLAGAITASIAITADAFNNLSDAASSVVTLVGFRMAERPADDEQSHRFISLRHFEKFDKHYISYSSTIFKPFLDKRGRST